MMADEVERNEQTEQPTTTAITAQDVQALLDDYYQRQSEDNAALRSDVDSSLKALQSDIDASLVGTQGAISADVAEQVKRAIDDAAKSDAGATVVILDAKQADWIQRGVQIGMTASVFVLIMLAAILGVKLWESFSVGWRRGA